MTAIKELIQKIRYNSKDYILALKLLKENDLLDLDVEISNKEINNRTYEDKLKIYIKPLQEKYRVEKDKQLNQYVGSKSEITNYMNCSYDEQPINIRLKDFIRTKSELVIGNYLKERNIIIVGFNPFGEEKYNYSWSIFKFIDLIKYIKSKSKIESVDTSKLKMKILSLNFFKGIENRIGDLKKDINDSNRYILEREQQILNRLRESREKEIILNVLTNGRTDREKLFLEELDKLNHLSFLKKWEIEGTNLVFYFENVCAFYKGNNIYLGEYKVELLDNGQFKWTCLNPIKSMGQSFNRGGSSSKGTTLIHPHINGSDNYAQCWGDKGNDVRKAVTNGEYSVVVTYINMFLRTYYDLSPHRDIGYWSEYNDKYKRSFENQKVE